MIPERCRMQEFFVEIQRTLVYMLAWVSFLIVGCLTGGRAEFVPGLILGSSGSIIYFLLLSYRIKNSATMTPEQAVGYMRSGWLIRLVFVTAILIVSLKIPAIDFLAAVVGLFSLQFILYAQAVLTVLKGLLCKFILERKE